MTWRLQYGSSRGLSKIYPDLVRNESNEAHIKWTLAQPTMPEKSYGESKTNNSYDDRTESTPDRREINRTTSAANVIQGPGHQRTQHLIFTYSSRLTWLGLGSMPPLAIICLGISLNRILRHDSRNKVRHSWKIPRSFAENRSRVAPVQDKCSNRWAKESTLWSSCQRLIIYCRSYTKSTLCRYIGESVSTNEWAATWDFQQCGLCDQQSIKLACTHAQSDQNLC